MQQARCWLVAQDEARSRCFIMRVPVANNNEQQKGKKIKYLNEHVGSGNSTKKTKILVFVN